MVTITAETIAFSDIICNQLCEGQAQGSVDSDVIPAVCIAISGAYLGGLFLQGIVFIIGGRKRRNKARVMSGSVEVCVQKIVGIVGQ